VSTDGRAQALANREMSVSSVAWTLSRERIAETGETADGVPEVWFGDAPDGGLAQVTSLNAPLAAAKLCRPQIYRYKSFDGREIEAALLKPDGASGPLPTIALIHGGPTGAWRDGFEAWGQLLANAGYAVFYPNIRGSTGYGYDFMISNRADWGGGDFKDIMAGLDDLVARRIADPARLGIGGWSYGGYMASWAITQTTRFKAAVSGAGMSDLAHEFSTEDNPAYDEWFYGLPYEKPEGFRRSSPLTYITKAKTPTLILQGEDDVVDPVGQSVALYRALKRYGVETELVLYPREGHGLREEQHLLDRLRRIVAWYDAHLKAEPTSSR
jgi:dipeptidyl aminopeptidase/acylaminoacyl peptidase